MRDQETSKVSHPSPRSNHWGCVRHRHSVFIHLLLGFRLSPQGQPESVSTLSSVTGDTRYKYVDGMLSSVTGDT